MTDLDRAVYAATTNYAPKPGMLSFDGFGDVGGGQSPGGSQDKEPTDPLRQLRDVLVEVAPRGAAAFRRTLHPKAREALRDAEQKAARAGVGGLYGVPRAEHDIPPF